MKTHGLLLVCAGFLVLFTGGCGVELAPDLEVDGAIVVGMTTAQSSFVFEEEGEITGVFADMVRDLGLYLNRETEVEILEEGTVMQAVRSRSVDLGFVLDKQADEEEGAVVFSKPFAWLGLAFLTAADSELDAVEDLNSEGRVIAVVRDTRAGQFARTALPQATVRELDGEDEAVQAVLEGDVHGFVHDSLKIFELVDGRGERLRAVLEPFRRVGVSIGVYSENEALLEAVNDFLHDYREIGGFDRLADRYFSEAQEAFEVQGADFLFDPPERVVIEDTDAGGFSLE